MRLAVLSDTHDNRTNTLRALKKLQPFNVEAVLHCGDLVSPSMIELFADWPTHFVFGNCDFDRDALRDTIEAAGQTCHERFAELKWDSRRIAMLHGDDSRHFRETVDSETYDLVCYGHTHQYEHHQQGRTLVLNPGALHRARRHSLALVDVENLAVETIFLDE